MIAVKLPVLTPVQFTCVRDISKMKGMIILCVFVLELKYRQLPQKMGVELRVS